MEGLTIYLTKEDVAELFAGLADLGTTGSRLAVSFESGFERQRVLRLLTRIYYRRAGEPLRFRLRPEDAPAFFSEAGWTIDTLLTGSDLEKEHLSETKLAGTLNTSSFAVIAKKPGWRRGPGGDRRLGRSQPRADASVSAQSRSTTTSGLRRASASRSSGSPVRTRRRPPRRITAEALRL